MANHRHLALTVAVGTAASLSKVKNKKTTWGHLLDRCATPTRGAESLAEYMRLPVDTQARLKNTGFFVGGACANDWRNTANIATRSVVALDIDNGTPALLDRIQLGLTALSSYEWSLYTTRKHTPTKPRARLVAPLAHEISAEKFAPLARILASLLDPTMESVDDVSFRLAQLMYWPSVCADGEFISFHNAGKLIDGDAILTAFGNWADWTKLPFSSGQGQKRPTEPHKKAEIPTEKTGIIGAFCRTYDIETAIEKFIPDVYTPSTDGGGKPRYTYAAGTTANGAVVEDDGLFLYSFHTSDPCGERLVNAWDMVRLHKFGELDADIHDETRPGSLPSHKAMLNLLQEDEAVGRELVQERYDIVRMFEDLGPTEKTDTPDEGPTTNREDLLGNPVNGTEKTDSQWITTLEITGTGVIKATVTNVAKILHHDPRLKDVIAFNEFTQEVVARQTIRSRMEIMPGLPIHDTINGDLWSDRHDNAVRCLLEEQAGKHLPGYGLRVSDRDLKAAVQLAAEHNKFHPVRDYLTGLKWDGTPRIDHLFPTYLGSPASAYTCEAARLMMIGGVVRVFEPGHKFDFVVILEGLQGKRKSTFVSILAKHWFANLDGPFRDRKRLIETMQGSWILEMPELSVFSRGEVAEIKAFVSEVADKARLAYDRRARVFRRQCIFVGSTNEDQYLRDSTGGRRFWPVPCRVTEIDTDRLVSEIDQLWAEAVALYRQMREEQPYGTLPLYLLSNESKAEALMHQEQRRVETAEDGLSGAISSWLETPMDLNMLGPTKEFFDDLDGGEHGLRTRCCLLEIWCECLGGDRERYTSTNAQALGKAMRLVPGWEMNGRANVPRYGRQRLYVRIADSLI